MIEMTDWKAEVKMNANPYIDNGNNSIRYDMKDLNSLKKHVVILGILVGILTAVAITAFGIWGTRSTVKDYQVAIMAVSMYGTPVFVLFFLKYLVKWGNCRNYLAKLKMRKMQIPERKEDYHCNLAELVTGEMAELESENRVAVWEVVMSVVPMICFLGWEIYLVIEYSAASDVILLAAPVFLFWTFVILQTVLHCSEKKYKDETNPDPARKPRASFFSFLAFVLFFAMVSVYWMGMVQSMADYVDRSVEEKDVSFLSGINTAATCALYNVNVDSPKMFVIVFEKDGYRIEDSENGAADAETQGFIEEFKNLTNHDAVSLSTINDNLGSRTYGTLEKLEITVDAWSGSTKLVATPQRKGVDPLVISSGTEK